MSYIEDGAFCENSYWLETVNYFFKSLIRCLTKLWIGLCILRLPLFCSYFLHWFWYGTIKSIDAAQLPPPWRFTIDECHQILPNFVILWRTIYCMSLSRGEGGGDWGGGCRISQISYVTVGGDRKWSLQTVTKGEGGLKKVKLSTT